MSEEKELTGETLNWKEVPTMPDSYKEFCDKCFDLTSRAFVDYFVEKYWCPICEKHSEVHSSVESNYVLKTCCKDAGEILKQLGQSCLQEMECTVGFVHAFLKRFEKDDELKKLTYEFFKNLKIKEFGSVFITRHLNILYAYIDKTENSIVEKEKSAFKAMKEKFMVAYNSEDAELFNKMVSEDLKTDT